MSFDAADLLARLFREEVAGPRRPAPPAPGIALPLRLDLGGLLPCPAPEEPAPAGGEPRSTSMAGKPVPRWRRSPRAVAPPPECPWCDGTLFWVSIYGSVCCGECEPPRLPALAERWLRVVETDDGPRAMRVGTPPSKE
jgi:hypothetical protein